MKKISIAAAFFLLIAFGIFSIGGANLTYGDQMNSMEMSNITNSQIPHANPCRFMGETNICFMSPLTHIKYFQSMLFAVLPNTILLALASLLAMLAVIVLRRRTDLCTVFKKWLSAMLRSTLWPPWFQYEKTEIGENPILRSFTKLHPRLYA